MQNINTKQLQSIFELLNLKIPLIKINSFEEQELLIFFNKHILVRNNDDSQVFLNLIADNRFYESFLEKQINFRKLKNQLDKKNEEDSGFVDFVIGKYFLDINKIYSFLNQDIIIKLTLLNWKSAIFKGYIPAIETLGSYYRYIHRFDKMKKYYKMGISKNDINSIFYMAAAYHDRYDEQLNEQIKDQDDNKTIRKITNRINGKKAIKYYSLCMQKDIENKFFDECLNQLNIIFLYNDFFDMNVALSIYSNLDKQILYMLHDKLFNMNNDLLKEYKNKLKLIMTKITCVNCYNELNDQSEKKCVFRYCGHSTCQKHLKYYCKLCQHDG